MYEVEPSLIVNIILFSTIFPPVLRREAAIATGGFLLLRNFSVSFSVSLHVCFILVLILISMFLR